MATRTVDESDGKRKGEEEREEAHRELDAAMVKFAEAELACSEVGTAPAVLLDRRLRTAALESTRRGCGRRTGRRTRHLDCVRGAAVGRGCCGARRRR